MEKTEEEIRDEAEMEAFIAKALVNSTRLMMEGGAVSADAILGGMFMAVASFAIQNDLTERFVKMAHSVEVGTIPQSTETIQ